MCVFGGLNTIPGKSAASYQNTQNNKITFILRNTNLCMHLICFTLQNKTKISPRNCTALNRTNYACTRLDSFMN